MRKRRTMSSKRKSSSSKRLKSDDKVNKEPAVVAVQNVEPEVENEEDNVERVLNPLLHSVVLRNLFPYYDVDDLKSARLVCRAWREAAGPFLQRQSIVRLYCPDTGEKNSNSIALRRAFHRNSSQKIDARNRPLSEYINYLATVPPNPIFHKNFLLSCTVMSQQRRSERDIRMFWDMCGNQIESLRLVYCCIVGIDILAMILSRPNLRSVSLENSFVCKNKDFASSTREIVKYNSDTFLKSFSNLKLTSFGLHGSMNLKSFPWTQLFETFPNITDLRVDSLAEEDINNFLDTLSKFAKDGKTKVTKLHFTPKDEYLGTVKSRLASLKVITSTLKLQSLSTQFYSRIEDQMFPDILKLCSSTLSSLTLTRVPLSMGVPEVISRHDDNFDFRGKIFAVQYPNLKHLRLFHNFLSDLDEVTVSCPKLKKLELIFAAASSFISGFNVKLRHDMLDNLVNSKVNSTIEELCVDVDYTNIFISYSLSHSQQRNLMEKLLSQLPKFGNLKALRTSLGSSKELRILMNTVPNLEELTILRNSCYVTKEEDLIGSNPPKPLEPRKKLIKKRKKTQPNNNSLPGIGIFNNLRRLHLDNDNRHLTDRAISLGFCQLTELRYLKLHNATEVSFQAFGEMREKLPKFISISADFCDDEMPISSSSSSSDDLSSVSSLSMSSDSD